MLEAERSDNSMQYMISEMLNSSADSEILDGLKKVLALLLMGRNVDSYFMVLGKVLRSKDVEVRKLAFFIISHTFNSPENEELAMMPVNYLIGETTNSDPQ